MLRASALLFFLASALFSALFAQQTEKGIVAQDIKTHISYLASDALKGRASGTEGAARAAKYISGLMEKYGLTPANADGSFFQLFDFVSTVKLGEDNALEFKGSGVPDGDRECKVDVEFRPLSYSSSAELKAPLVFAGYGISAPDSNYDDYHGLDVKGKAVIILRYAPDGTSPRGRFSRYSSFRNKARVARDRGAVAALFVSGPADDQDDELVKLAADRSFGDAGIPVISVKRAAVEGLFQKAGKTLKTVQDSIRSSMRPLVFDFPDVTVSLSASVVQVKSDAMNVAGYLEGNDPVLKNEVIVVGAHYDHLGEGGPGSGSMQPDTVGIHHGADDNASGTAGLLELAEAFASAKDQLRRTILFVSFSGEELGTLGSGFYVTHPLFPLDRTVAMVNLDMIGRMENKSLTVYGTGTSPAWNGYLSAHNTDSTFVLKEIPDGYGPSDHAQFYGKDIPVLFFFTGTHNDYHRPADTWEKINYPGEEQIVRYAYQVTRDIDTMAVRPKFTKAESSAPIASGDTRGFSVTMGVIPDVGENAGKGLRISGVRPKGPAERAGLKSGDVITMLAGRKVLGVYDYMGLLGELKAGDQVEVEVLRDGKAMKFTATMDKRK